MAEETLEEAAKRHADSYYNKNSEFCSVIYESVEWSNRNHNFIAGAKWQAREMYTYDDIRFIAYNAFCLGQMDNPTENKYNHWIEQFKK